MTTGASPTGADQSTGFQAGGMPLVRDDDGPGAAPARGSPLEVLVIATRLGLTSFGGPVAHLGYFREEYVNRRKWVDEAT